MPNKDYSMENEENDDAMVGEVLAEGGEEEGAEEEGGEEGLEALGEGLGDLEGGEEPAGSLEEGVQGLIDAWQPETPEGERYKQELEQLQSSIGGAEGEEMGGLPEMGEMGEMGPIPTAPLGDMRNAAAARMKDRGLV